MLSIVFFIFSIHPFLPIVASSSGQRHYEVFDDSESEDDTTKNLTYTNDLRLWWFSWFLKKIFFFIKFFHNISKFKLLQFFYYIYIYTYLGCFKK